MGAKAFVVVVAAYLSVQGITLLYTNEASGCISIYELLEWLGNREYTGALLVSSLPITVFAVLALMHPIWRLLLLVPQVSITFLYAVGAAKAIYLGSYADMVLRSHEFILDDQLPIFLILYFHTMSVLSLVLRNGNGNRNGRS